MSLHLLVSSCATLGMSRSSGTALTLILYDRSMRSAVFFQVAILRYLVKVASQGQGRATYCLMPGVLPTTRWEPSTSTSMSCVCMAKSGMCQFVSLAFLLGHGD